MESKVDLAPFWYWITERHAINLRKESGQKPPFTKDPILQEYAFCNVFRELDRVTQWIDLHWRQKYADHPNLWFAMCLARQINWPPTLEAIGFPDRSWDPQRVRATMLDLQSQRKKVYTGAYMLRGDIQRGTQPNDKPTYTCFTVLDPVWRDYQNRLSRKNGGFDAECVTTSIQETVKWLESFDGWGGFLSYEVATDLRHTRYLRHAPDIMTWANPGPGAIRGLNRLFGRPLKLTISRNNAIAEMHYLLDQSSQVLSDCIPALEMRDIEHSLCETDKYLRVKNGEGRPRAKYHWDAPKEY